MNEMQYTSVDRVFASLYRSGLTDINEGDAIEWMGEALDQLKVMQVQEQVVTFVEVKDFEVDMPQGLQLILQIARNNRWSPDNRSKCLPCPTVVPDPESDPCTPPDEYRPCFDMQWQYIPWTSSNWYINDFTPVRLSNNTFFKSLVCKEKSPYRGGHSGDSFYQMNYGNQNLDEYTIVGSVEKKIRFSFQEGFVAISYLRNVMDPETGYPLIPDNISYLTAINYYVKWKLAERYDWMGREGFGSKAEQARQLWNKYCAQSKSWAKMPKTIDDFQDLLEQSHYLIPNNKRYYNYFGNLGRPEDRKFNNPDNRGSRGYRNNLSY